MERRRSRAQVIFNLAGEISHLHSMEYPERDLQINALAEPRFLQECAGPSCGVRVVYAGTRQIYGMPEFLPVDESHLISPEDFNGIHKYAAMLYHLTLSRMGHAVALQLTKVYRPREGFGRAAPRLSAGVFPQASAESTDRDLWRCLQLRDPVHVDNVVQALLLAGQAQVSQPRRFIGRGNGPNSLCGWRRGRPLSPVFRNSQAYQYRTLLLGLRLRQTGAEMEATNPILSLCRVHFGIFQAQFTA